MHYVPTNVLYIIIKKTPFVIQKVFDYNNLTLILFSCANTPNTVT